MTGPYMCCAHCLHVASLTHPCGCGHKGCPGNVPVYRPRENDLSDVVIPPAQRTPDQP